MSGKLIIAFCILNFLGLAALSALHFFHRPTIVYVHSSRVIDSYQGMINARKEYQAKALVWQANIDTLAKEVQSHVRNLEQATSAQRKAMEQLVHAKQQELIDYQRAINDLAGQENDRMTKKVISEINAYIRSYGPKKKYTIIFAATDQGNIAFAEEHLDISEEIIEGLNKQYKGME